MALLPQVERYIRLSGIAPSRLTAVEYDAGFAARVRERCPSVQVIKGDAFNLEKTLDGKLRGQLAAVVSSLPLLPTRV